MMPLMFSKAKPPYLVLSWILSWCPKVHQSPKFPFQLSVEKKKKLTVNCVEFFVKTLTVRWKAFQRYCCTS